MEVEHRHIVLAICFSLRQVQFNRKNNINILDFKSDLSRDVLLKKRDMRGSKTPASRIA